MSNHGLTVTYRPDLPAVIARWETEVSPTELQAGYQAVQEVADTHHCSRWLLDLRRRNDLSSPEVAQWVVNSFLPGLTGRYAHPVRVAFVVSPSRASSSAPPPAPPFDLTAEYQTGTFIDEAAAYEWLADGPAHP